MLRFSSSSVVKVDMEVKDARYLLLQAEKANQAEFALDRDDGYAPVEYASTGTEYLRARAGSGPPDKSTSDEDQLDAGFYPEGQVAEGLRRASESEPLAAKVTQAPKVTAQPPKPPPRLSKADFSPYLEPSASADDCQVGDDPYALAENQDLQNSAIAALDATLALFDIEEAASG